MFKSFSCGEECLESAKTLRALEGKICACEPRNTCWSLFSDPLGEDCPLYPFSFISCPELSVFLFAVDFQQSFLWHLSPEKKLEEKGGLRGEVLFLLFLLFYFTPQAIAGLQGEMRPALMGLSQPGAHEGLGRSREDL